MVAASSRDPSPDWAHWEYSFISENKKGSKLVFYLFAQIKKYVNAVWKSEKEKLS